MSETNFAANTNPLTLILEQLATITQRLDAIESRPSNMSIPVSNVPRARATSVQHGIRARELWRDKNYVLPHEPMKNTFRLEHQKDYTVWSFSFLKLADSFGLTPFVLGSATAPVLPEDGSATEEDV